jgi:hypothetical protein
LRALFVILPGKFSALQIMMSPHIRAIKKRAGEQPDEFHAHSSSIFDLRRGLSCWICRPWVDIAPAPDAICNASASYLDLWASSPRLLVEWI